MQDSIEPAATWAAKRTLLKKNSLHHSYQVSALTLAMDLFKNVPKESLFHSQIQPIEKGSLILFNSKSEAVTNLKN